MTFATSDVMFDAQADSLATPTPAAEGEGQAPVAPEPAAPAEASPEITEANPANPQQESTTPETPDAATSEQNASAIPKELETHKDFLASKGLDHKAQDFVPKVVQMAKEAESLTGRKASEAKLMQNRLDDLHRDLASGGLNSVNKWREANGLPKMQEPKSSADQLKEHSELVSHISNAVQGNADSLKWLNETLMPKLENLKYDARDEAKNGGANPALKAHQEFLQTATGNIQKFVAANQDKAGHLDALMPLVEAGGLLHSHGIDRAHMAATPERLEAWAKIGEALDLMQPDPKQPGKTKLDAHIEARVQQALDDKRRAVNKGLPQGGPGLRNGVQATQKSGTSGLQIGWGDFH
jgi:hypothetical protein